VALSVQLFFRTFTDAFQSCYKDGLNGTLDFRFLSSAPMFSYIFLSLRSFEVDSRRNYVWVIYCVVTFIFSSGFAYMRPFNPLTTIVPKGILPQSYDNRAFWHDFKGIPISDMEACSALKLHCLKLHSLNG